MLYGRYSPAEGASELCFKTNRDEKSCLSLEIKCLKVEDHLKNLDFTSTSMVIPLVMYIGNSITNHVPQL